MYWLIYLAVLIGLMAYNIIAGCVFLYVTYNLWVGHVERQEELAGIPKRKKNGSGVIRGVLGILSSRALWKAFSRTIR